MSLLPVGFGGGAIYDIGKSLRLRSSASAYLSRTFAGSGTDKKKGSFSCWVKRGSLGAALRLVDSYDGSSGASSVLYFSASDQLIFDFGGAGSTAITTSAVYRDPSAHFHVLLAYDTTQATASDRVKLYVNGTQVTSFASASYPALNALCQWFSANANNRIASNWSGVAGTFFDGYLSEINFVDGQALAATSFGEFDANGIWVPKKYAGTYGANGFYLPFDNGTSLTTLAQDRSGNGNNFTASGISLTAGVTYDWLDDTPTCNFATLNPLHAGRSTLSNVNLTASGATDLPTILPDSGTWYFEISGVSKTWAPPAAFPAGAGDYNFGQRPFTNTATAPKLCTKNLPSGASITTSGSFTGNAAADGPFVWLKGNPSTMTINGNAVTWGTHADKTAGGFKVRTSAATHNTAGSNTYSVTVTGKLFGDSARTPNTAQGNP